MNNNDINYVLTSVLQKKKRSFYITVLKIFLNKHILKLQIMLLY